MPGPEDVTPSADSTRILVSRVDKLLDFDGDIPVVLGGDGLLRLQDILSGLEIGTSGEPGAERVTQLRPDFSRSSGPILVFGHIEQLLGGYDFSDVVFEILENAALRARQIVALPDSVCYAPPVGSLEIGLGLDEDILRRFQLEFELVGVAVTREDRIAVLHPELSDSSRVFGDAGDDLEFGGVEHDADIVDEIESKAFTSTLGITATLSDDADVQIANILIDLDQAEDLASEFEGGVVGAELLELLV